MTQSAILGKLSRHLDAGITREADAVYLLIEIGKYLAQESKPGYPLLRFYRNWVAHDNIKNLEPAGDIPTELNKAVEAYYIKKDQTAAVEAINQVVSMDRLRTELLEFAKEVGLPSRLMDSDKEWRAFVRLLISVLADVPLIFSGFRLIQTFRFVEYSLGGDVNRKLPSWRIEGPGYTFEGGVFFPVA